MLILPLTFYDTYLKQIVSLKPEENENKILKIYSCGPTVYSYLHIGNLRASWLPDTVVKLAKLSGWKTKWVTNITDVGHLVGDGDDGEDKIELSSKKENKTPQEIANFYFNFFIKEANLLNLTLPKDQNLPFASNYIEEQMQLALSLLQLKKAYILEDGIYFDSQKSTNDLPNNPIFKIKNTLENQEYQTREIKNTTKNPNDFALWKFIDEKSLQKWRFLDYPKILQNYFESENTEKNLDKFLLNKWGCPGWHSECVSMIYSLFSQKNKIQIILDKIINYLPKLDPKNEINIDEAKLILNLPTQVYKIAREKDTEAPFSGQYCALKKEGKYYCKVCQQFLFKSQNKYESGTGWPSYFAPSNEFSITTEEDYSHNMIRTEVKCSRCKSHLGHLFKDGPNPTGLRYCINSHILEFYPLNKKIDFLKKILNEEEYQNIKSLKLVNKINQILNDYNELQVYTKNAILEIKNIFLDIINDGFKKEENNSSSIIDLHFGGEDHIDLHHKNEILISKNLGINLSKYWVHNKFVLINKQKMSKSLGNVFLVTGKNQETGFFSLTNPKIDDFSEEFKQQITKKLKELNLIQNSVNWDNFGFDPLAYKLMMFEHHYTETINFTWEKLWSSQVRLWNLKKEGAKINFFILKNIQSNLLINNFEDNLQLQEMLKIANDNLNLPKLLEIYQKKLIDLANLSFEFEPAKINFYKDKLLTCIIFDRKLFKLNIFPHITIDNEKEYYSIPEELLKLANNRLDYKKIKKYELADKIRQEIQIKRWQIDDYKDFYTLWDLGINF